MAYVYSEEAELSSLPAGMEQLSSADATRFQMTMHKMTHHHALCDKRVDTSQPHGVLISLDGPIGAGKSTLGKMMQAINQYKVERSLKPKPVNVFMMAQGGGGGGAPDTGAVPPSVRSFEGPAREKGDDPDVVKGDFVALPDTLKAADKNSRFVFMPETAHRAVLGSYLEHPKDLSASMQSRMWNDAMHRQATAVKSLESMKDKRKSKGAWVVVQDRSCVGNAAIAVANGVLGCMSPVEMGFYKVGTRQIPHLAHGLDVIVYVDTSVQGCIRRLSVRGDEGEADTYQDAYFCAVERAHLCFFVAEAARGAGADVGSEGRLLRGWTVVQEESCPASGLIPSVLDTMERFLQRDIGANPSQSYPIRVLSPFEHASFLKRAKETGERGAMIMSASDMLEIHGFGETGDDTVRMRSLVSSRVTRANSEAGKVTNSPFLIEAYPSETVQDDLVVGATKQVAFLTRSRGIRRWMFSAVAMGHTLLLPSPLPFDDCEWIQPFLAMASRK